MMTRAIQSEIPVIFEKLRNVMAKQAEGLSVQKDTRDEYTLVTKSPSPFRQHNGQPMHFGYVRRGKAYVSFHLLALYMDPTFAKTISPGLKKRMQGKTCFNFTAEPEQEIIAELERLTEEAYRRFHARKWA